MIRHILTTGAAGFIFSNFTHYWVKKYPGSYPCIVDKLTYAGNMDNLAPLDDDGDIAPYIGDAADPVLMDYLCKENKLDLMIIGHSESHVDNSIKDSKPFINSNIVGVWSCLEAARKYNVPVLLMSTDETLVHRGPYTYKEPNGDEFTHFFRIKEDFTEADPFLSPVLGGTSPYAASKASAEVLARAWEKTYGMDIKIVRCTNVYGPRQHPEKLVSKTITNALNNKSIPLYGKGEQWRDYLYIDDFCKALDLIIHKGSAGETYHIAANLERQNINTVKAILGQLDKPESLIEYIEDPRGNSHDYSYSLDCEKTKALGWKPKIQFGYGIEKTIKYYQELNLCKQ